VSKKLHVCVDGLNLALTKGTGLATYARNLSHYLYHAHHKVSILFDKNLNEKAVDNFYQAAFYESLSQPSEKERRPRSSKMHYLLIPFYLMKSVWYLMRIPRAKEHFFSDVAINEEMKKRLPEFDTIYNSAHLYRLAQCYFMIFGRLLPIKLSPTPDIMHWTCPIPARVVGAKNYYTIHDLVPLRLPHATQENKAFFYKLIWRIVQAADRVITVSECSRNDIIAYFPVSQGKVINTYQNVSVAETWSQDQQRVSENQLRDLFGLEPKAYFIFVGAIEPKKNLARLIEAFISTDVEQKLVIVGALAWQSEKESALLKQHAERVIYLSYVSHDALKMVMRQARALIFPSLYEGFGLPVIEAMSIGVPVITSRVSSLPEIAGDAAYLVNPYEVSDISAAIHCLSKDDALCIKLTQKGTDRASYFSDEAYAERLRLVYSC
jgi:glycosyltransferase involved in cell wall biosynthesis